MNRITISVEAFRSVPDKVWQQALDQEVEIVVSDTTAIYVTRRMPPLDDDASEAP